MAPLSRQSIMNPSLRRSILSPTHRLSTIRATQLLSTRQFTLSTHHQKKLSTDDTVKTDAYPDSEHATSKTKHDTNDVQSANAKAGQDANDAGTGGSGTGRKDSQGAVAKAKKENPEAPDPAIGMQDERGGKGG